jgi:hypothetical protein
MGYDLGEVRPCRPVARDGGASIGTASAGEERRGEDAALQFCRFKHPKPRIRGIQLKKTGLDSFQLKDFFIF